MEEIVLLSDRESEVANCSEYNFKLILCKRVMDLLAYTESVVTLFIF